MRKEELSRIGVTEILGKEIEFYGSWEEPCFVAKSVADWIDYDKSSINKMLDKVDSEEKFKYIPSEDYSEGSLQANTEYWFLTEDGIHEVLMQSRKPIAKQLKSKIKQYLKQIRKTGGVVEEGREEEFISKYFPSFSEEVQLSMVQDLLKTNKELKPKADYYDGVLKPTDSNYKKLLTVSEIAKDLGSTAQKLNKILHEKKIIYKQSDTWMPYADYQHMIPDYMDYHITEFGQTLKFTELGREWIIGLLKEKNN